MNCTRHPHYSYQGNCTHTDPVFGIGMFKTGVTSLGATLDELGYTSQRPFGGFFPYKVRYMYDNLMARSLLPTVIAKNFTFAKNAGGWRGIEEAFCMTLHSKDGPWLFSFDLLERSSHKARFVLTERNPWDLLVSDVNHISEWFGRNEQSA